MIVYNGTPFNFAIDEAAALVLCVVKLRSIPAFDNINLTHLLIVFWDAALCGLIVLIINFVLASNILCVSSIVPYMSRYINLRPVDIF